MWEEWPIPIVRVSSLVINQNFIHRVLVQLPTFSARFKRLQSFLIINKIICTSRPQNTQIVQYSFTPQVATVVRTKLFTSCLDYNAKHLRSYCKRVFLQRF